MRRRKLSPWILAFMMSAGCGNDPQVPGVRADAGGDVSAVDVALDTAVDALDDRAVDVVFDLADDTRADASTDLAADTALDAAGDVVLDRAATDAPRDGSADAGDGTMMAMVGPYPAGPYGNNEGDVLANLPWEGYANLAGGAVSTMRPYGSTSLQAMRETGRAYALVHLSEFY